MRGIVVRMGDENDEDNAYGERMRRRMRSRPASLLNRSSPQKLIELMRVRLRQGRQAAVGVRAREMPDERWAVSLAREMAHRHGGVITWSREADKELGEYVPPEVLFQSGNIPTSTRMSPVAPASG